jgi:hypothetical protein
LIIDYETPLECLFQTKPNYLALRVFGCACWPNLHPYNQHKLQFRSKQHVFLGYNNQNKGFKCLDVAEGRVYISRDVVFDETVYPFAKLNPNSGVRLREELSLIPFDNHVGVCLTNPTLVDFPNPTNEAADDSPGHNGPIEQITEEKEEGMDQFHDSQRDFMQL